MLQESSQLDHPGTKGTLTERYPVLKTDTDPQGHLATGLGLEKAPGIKRLVSWHEGQSSPLIISARERLDLIPSDPRTSNARQRLGGMPFREDFLDKAMAGLTMETQAPARPRRGGGPTLITSAK